MKERRSYVPRTWPQNLVALGLVGLFILILSGHTMNPLRVMGASVAACVGEARPR